MKKYLFSAAVFTAVLISLSFNIMKDFPAQREHKDSNPNNPQVLETRQLNVNNISTFFRNNGAFNRDFSTGNSGFEWPIGQGKYARYASGIWLGGIVNGDTLLAIAEYDNEFLPGFIDDNGIHQGTNDPNYRIFNFSDNDTSDYGAWRSIASLQGAYLNGSGNPFRMGSQTMFYSYSDGDSLSHMAVAGRTAPLKAQILQTNWSYINMNTRDAVFTEYRVINRGNRVWNNFYISIWTDDDLGYPLDDAVGIDTSAHTLLGYTYNFTDNDPDYGSAPPAVGFTILRGPVVPSPGDTVRYYNPPGSDNLVVRANYKELKLSSFNNYTNGDPSAGDPTNFREAYRNMEGLKRDGTPWRDPVTNEISQFPFSGSPETSSGWIENTMGDRRSLLSIGPLTVNPGDTQSVIITQVIARGSDNLNSISKLRQIAQYVHGLYNTNFQSVSGISNISNSIPEKINLYQNYPNPFNPVTKIKFDIPADAGRSSSKVKLTVYNSLGREVITLVNTELRGGSYEVSFSGEGLSSGIYFYRLQAGENVQTKKMTLIK
ncbi:MAG: T9SS type A sorting domain-containing protein [Bacteroidetes bacterium]|nr:T9SS type A sorting domain-containing protein [Bacteroidota bacterium]